MIWFFDLDTRTNVYEFENIKTKLKRKTAVAGRKVIPIVQLSEQQWHKEDGDIFLDFGMGEPLEHREANELLPIQRDSIHAVLCRKRDLDLHYLPWRGMPFHGFSSSSPFGPHQSG